MGWHHQRSDKKRSDDGGPLEAVVEQLSSRVNHLSVQLNAGLSSVNAEIAALKTKTATLDKMVAFHTWSGVNPVQVAPLGIIILSHVITNVGNAYDGLTGVFTTPVSGLYDFQATILSDNLGSGQGVDSDIIVDNSRVATAVSDTNHGQWDQATMSCIIHLNAGQKVFLKSRNSGLKEYHGWPTAPYTTFSGFLVKAD